MDLQVAKILGAAFATIPLIAVAFAIGHISSTLISSVARNPSIKDDANGYALFGIVFVEMTGLFSLLISFMILFAV